MELRRLEHFVAVAEEQSFTRAAERLHMSQSPLSASVRRLELQLGVTLLDRTSRRVELTAAGAVLLGDARELLAAAQACTDRVRRVAAGRAGRVTLAHTATVSYAFLPRLRSEAQRSLVDVELVAEEARSRDIVAAVRRGETDLGLCCSPDGAVGLERVRLGSEPLALLVAEDHPLAGGPPVDLRSVAGARFQLFPREQAPAFYDHLVGVLHHGGAAPRLVEEHVATRGRERIASGELVALAPRSLGTVSAPGTVMLELRDPSPSVTVEAILRAGQPASAPVHRLISLAAALAPAPHGGSGGG